MLSGFSKQGRSLWRQVVSCFEVCALQMQGVSVGTAGWQQEVWQKAIRNMFRGCACSKAAGHQFLGHYHFGENLSGSLLLYVEAAGLLC